MKIVLSNCYFLSDRSIKNISLMVLDPVSSV